MNRRRAVIGALLLCLVASALALPGIQLAGGMSERLTNGSFEEGFESRVPGFVGKGWSWFNSGGNAEYGFYRDPWAPVVLDGQTSQLIEINTMDYAASQADHYAGIYQTVSVVAGKSYELTVHGMIRALEDDPDRAGYNYRVQVGFDYDGGTAWQLVDNWVELPWDTVYPRLTPGAMNSFSTTVTATGDRLTLFVRAWYKWGTVGRELDVNLDAISLKGALPGEGEQTKAAVVENSGSEGGETYAILGGTEGGGSSAVLGGSEEVTAAIPLANWLTVSLSVPSFPVDGWEYTVSVRGDSSVGVNQLDLYDNGVLVGSSGYEVGPLSLAHVFHWKPVGEGNHVLKAVATDALGGQAVEQSQMRVGQDLEFLKNGGFESGFVEVAAGLVGEGWGAFHTGGRASYGFYDDTWAPIVAEGGHSQLIEINTYGRADSDPDRYAGIHQTVSGLTQGATYRVSLYGMLRALADDGDREGYGYRVEWGVAPEGGADWASVANWVQVPWDTVYPRLDPGEMEAYGGTFVASSEQAMLFIRAWKKWGTGEKELDVNLDSISLHGYK